VLEDNLAALVDNVLRRPILVSIAFHVAYSLSCATG
jgi:hypothetical protein